MHVCWLNKAFCLPLIIFHIIQPYPASMGNYFIKIINKKLQLILRGKSKVTQPPCFGSFALKRSILGKLLLRPVSFLQCRSWFWMGRFRKPWTSQSQPEAQVLLHICFSLNGWRTWREAWKGLWSHGERLGRVSGVMERGLEGPPKSISPSAAGGEGKRYIQAAARAVPGGCSAWKPWVHLLGITQ